MESYDEFDDPSKLQLKFRSLMTEEEYDIQGSEETHRALGDLMDYIEMNPNEYKEIVKKKKKMEYQNSSTLSFIKVKIMSAIGMENYLPCAVSQEECDKRLTHLKSSMCRAFNYAQDAKGRRYSKRLVSKGSTNKENCNMMPPLPRGPVKVVPPPPPPPPPVTGALPSHMNKTSGQGRSQPCSPLKDRNTIGITTPTSMNILEAKEKLNRTSRLRKDVSFVSLTEELSSTCPLQRLKSTKLEKSPGGTPIHRSVSKGQCNSSDPLVQAFNSVLQEKFRNVRSPSPRLQLNSWDSPTP